MADDEVRAAVVAERREQAELLGGLSDAQWDAPSLCAGWRTREVIAHTTMQYRMSLPRFALAMLKARGNFNRAADRMARADAATLSQDDLVAALRDNSEHPWTPPGGGPVGALSHDVIHGLDITVALGIDRTVPDRVGLVLAAMRPKNIAFFGTDLSGVSLRATDLDWTYGDGDPLHGTGADLLLVVCGRKLPGDRLKGEQAGRFTR
jgi:uncharacterized protein (TIGR03083 family)